MHTRIRQGWLVLWWRVYSVRVVRAAERCFIHSAVNWIFFNHDSKPRQDSDSECVPRLRTELQVHESTVCTSESLR